VLSRRLDGSGGELHVVRASGGPGLHLASSVASFRLAGARRLLYVSDEGTPGAFELYTVAHPGLARTRLGPPVPAGQSAHVELVSSDGQRALYSVGFQQNMPLESFLVATDGSAPAVRLARPDGTPAQAQSPRWTADQTGVLFFDLVNGAQLFRASASGASIALASDVAAPDRGVVEFVPSPDGQWVAFHQRRTNGLDQLYLAPTTGGPSSLIVSDRPGRFAFTADARSLVVLTQSTDLLNVSVADSSVLPLASGLGALHFELDPDGTHAGFLDLAEHLWLVPLDGSAPPARVSEFDAAVSRSFRLGQERAFYATRTSVGGGQLWSRAYTTLP